MRPLSARQLGPSGDGTVSRLRPSPVTDVPLAGPANGGAEPASEAPVDARSGPPHLGPSPSRSPVEGWVFPDGYVPLNLSYCRSCGRAIMWCLTRRDRKAPVDRDGQSHFATCPDDSWRRKR